MLIGTAGFSYAYYEGRDIQLKKTVFSHKDIPTAFDGKKIIFIADTHCNEYFTPEDAVALVERINKLKPDIIVLGGDYTNADSIYSVRFFDALKKLKATYGVFSVFGNHDFWEDYDLIYNGLVSTGANICDNRSYWIYEGNDSIKIGGVGDMWEDVQLPDNTTFDVKENDFCILLSHNPDYIEQVEGAKIDLMLSGHTHGGQVTIFGLYAPITPAFWKPELYDSGQKYTYGWKTVNNTTLYTTSGVGLGKFPFRFFASPEIVEITLRKE